MEHAIHKSGDDVQIALTTSTHCGRALTVGLSCAISTSTVLVLRCIYMYRTIKTSVHSINIYNQFRLWNRRP